MQVTVHANYSVGFLAVKEISFSLQRMMDSDYKSVRPVLAPPSSEPAVHPHGSLQDAPNSRPLHADHLQVGVRSYIYPPCIQGALPQS